MIKGTYHTLSMGTVLVKILASLLKENVYKNAQHVDGEDLPC